MRLVPSLVTVLALALTGCAADTTDTTETPTDSTTAPVGDPTDTDDAGDADEDVEDATDDHASGDDQQAGGDPHVEGDCSAAGLAADGDFAILGEEAHATAAFLLDAAVRCDEQLLFTAATESDTSFFFGSATVDQVFGLPEDADEDPAPWEALARLLHGTTPVEADGAWTWPTAFSADAGGAGDGAWQELVDSGLYTQQQVDQLRAAPDGYLGWRVGIDSDGTWLFFTAGD